MPDRVKFFYSEGCGPCHEVAELIRTGQFELDLEGAEIDMIDVTSEEGFPLVEAENVTAVPVAHFQGRECQLGIDHEAGVAVLRCREPDASNGPPGRPAKTRARD